MIRNAVNQQTSHEITMRIQAILVNYNGYADTIECLASLKAQTGVQCQPLVIDNASTNESVLKIRDAHPDVPLLVMENNLGFCGGNNVGIREALAAGFDYIYLVNNDTTMEPDCLQKLLECSRSFPQAASVSPAMYLYSDPSRPWFTGSVIDVKGGRTEHLCDDVRAQNRQDAFEIPWTTGCAMLIPADVMRLLGGFDERFFCYYEDVDWSLRAQDQGYCCVLCPTAILYHKVAATSGSHSPNTYYYNARNKMLCFSQHASGAATRMQSLKLGARSFTHLKQDVALLGKRTQARAFCAHLLGVFDFYRHRFGRCRYSWRALKTLSGQR